MKRIAVALCCLLLISATGVAVATTVESSFTVSIPGSTDIPEQTRSVDGTSVTVDSIARVNQGDTLRVQTDGPEGENYRIYIYANNDGTQQVYTQAFVDSDDDGAVSFDTSEYDAGSYVVTINREHDPLPLVVPAYNVSLSSPNTSQAQSAVKISASLTEVVSGESIENVEISVFNEETTEHLDTTETNDRYVATLDSETLKPGEYQVQAVVTGSEDAPYGANEVIGISDPSRLTVESSEQATTTTQAANGGGGGAGSSSTPSTSTRSQTSTQTQTASITTTITSSLVTENSSTETSNTMTSGTQSSVITPATGTVSTATTTTSTNGVVGETPLLLLALLATIGLLTRTTD